MVGPTWEENRFRNLKKKPFGPSSKIFLQEKISRFWLALIKEV